jgi:hypothetical protein
MRKNAAVKKSSRRGAASRGVAAKGKWGAFPQAGNDNTQPRPRRHVLKPELKKRGRQSESQPKAKVSIAIDVADLEWAAAAAKARDISLSAVFTEALHTHKRQQQLAALLQELGGADEFTDAEMEATRAELRQAGLRV